MDQLIGEAGGDKTSADLFAENVILSLPPLYALRGQLSGNPLEQLARPAETLTCKLQHFAVKHVAGLEARLPSGALRGSFRRRRRPRSMPISCFSCRAPSSRARSQPLLPAARAGGSRQPA